MDSQLGTSIPTNDLTRREETSTFIRHLRRRSHWSRIRSGTKGYDGRGCLEICKLLFVEGTRANDSTPNY